MPKIEPFEKFTDRYEKWFEDNKYVYLSELNAVKRLLPKNTDKCIEIGVGSGRFAAPLKIKYGLEPSKSMKKIAEERGINVYEGVAENLPFKDNTFDCVLMVTTICFLDDIERSLREIYRVLKDGGYIIIGFIDKNSPLGKLYQKLKNKNPFYKEAKFLSVEEVIKLLKKARFKNFQFVQTVFKKPEEIKEIEPVREGYGEGSFIVVRGQK